MKNIVLIATLISSMAAEAEQVISVETPGSYTETMVIRRRVKGKSTNYFFKRELEKVANKELFLVVPKSAKKQPVIAKGLKSFFTNYATACPGDRGLAKNSKPQVRLSSPVQWTAGRSKSVLEPIDNANKVKAYALDITDPKVTEKSLIEKILIKFKPYIFIAQFDHSGKEFSAVLWEKILKQIPKSQACFLISPSLSRFFNKLYLRRLSALLVKKNHSCQLVDVDEEGLSRHLSPSNYGYAGMPIRASGVSQKEWLKEFSYNICELDPRARTSSEGTSRWTASKKP